MIDCYKNEELNTVLLMQLKEEIKELTQNVDAKLLMQNGKIAETCVYISNHLSDELVKMFNTLHNSGELDRIITETITSDIELLKQDIYYDESLIYTEILKDYEETNSDYYVTHVSKYDKDGNRLVLRFGTGHDGLGQLESTVAFAHRKNASLVINCGVYNTSTHNPLGVCIKDGKCIHNELLTLSKFNYLGIDKLGDLHSFHHSTTVDEFLSAGMCNVTCTFTELIKDGVPVEQEDKTNYDPRQAIGQLANGDYIIVTVDGRSRDNVGFRYDDLIRIFQKYHTQFAIALDGGGSASTVVRGIKQNDDADDSFNDRPVSNFLYFVKDTKTISSLNPFNSIGWLKQRLTKYIKTLVNFDKGYIRLRAPKGQHYPGIEIYSNGDTTRTAKLGYTSHPDAINRIVFSMNYDGVEKNVFGASDRGLFDINGQMACFNSVPVLCEDVNTVKASGIYRCNTTTLNTPYPAVIGFLIHLSYNSVDSETNGNTKQFFFSKDKDVILTRNINNNGTFTDWRVPCNLKGGTSDRPEGVTGMMFFDTTIDKPIWYDGTKWVDSNGVTV